MVTTDRRDVTGWNPSRVIYDGVGRWARSPPGNSDPRASIPSNGRCARSRSTVVAIDNGTVDVAQFTLFVEDTGHVTLPEWPRRALGQYNRLAAFGEKELSTWAHAVALCCRSASSGTQG